MTQLQPSPEDIERFGSDPLTTFRNNLAIVEERIFQACVRAGSGRTSVQLLPITKTVPAHILRLACEAGIQTFGENKIQEASSKREALDDLAIDWRIVGHLQSNKAKYLARFATEFHALDSLRIAELLHKRLVLTAVGIQTTGGVKPGHSGSAEAAREARLR